MFNWRRPITPLTACLCVLAVHTSRAQSGTSPYSTSLTLTNGLSASQHVDLNASPLTFSGVGYDLGLGMRRGFGRWTFATTFDGAHRSYTTHLSAGTPSTETSFDGRLALSLVRELGGTPGAALGSGYSPTSPVASCATNTPIQEPPSPTTRTASCQSARRSPMAGRSATDWLASTSARRSSDSFTGPTPIRDANVRRRASTSRHRARCGPSMRA